MDFAKAKMLLDEAEKSSTMLSHGKKASAKECRKYLMEVKKMMDSGRKEALTTLKALPVKSRRKLTFDTHVFSEKKNVEPEEKNVKPEPEEKNVEPVEPHVKLEPIKKKPALKPRVKKN